MQTFLPYPEFHKSARVLDNKRLGKQRIECLQILNVLHNPSAKGWKNHPAVLMWKNHESCLAYYGLIVCKEWRSRGFIDNTSKKILVYFKTPMKYPNWLGKRKFHESHRSNLLRKDFNWYSAFGWNESNDLKYFWPTKHGFLV